MTRIEEKVASLEKELLLTKKYLIPLEEAGFVGRITSNRIISVDIRSVSAEEIRALLNMFPAGSTNRELSFAGKENVETSSPFIIHVQNSADTNPVFKVKYMAQDGMDIWITLQMDTDNECVAKKKIIQTRIIHGSEVLTVVGYNYFVDIGSQQRYYGGVGGRDDYEEICSYASDAEEAEKIRGFLFGDSTL